METRDGHMMPADETLWSTLGLLGPLRSNEGQRGQEHEQQQHQGQGQGQGQQLPPSRGDGLLKRSQEIPDGPNDLLDEFSLPATNLDLIERLFSDIFDELSTGPVESDRVISPRLLAGPTSQPVTAPETFSRTPLVPEEPAWDPEWYATIYGSSDFVMDSAFLGDPAWTTPPGGLQTGMWAADVVDMRHTIAARAAPDAMLPPAGAAVAPSASSARVTQTTLVLTPPPSSGEWLRAGNGARARVAPAC